MILLKNGQMVGINRRAKVRPCIIKEQKKIEERKTADGIVSRHPVTNRSMELFPLEPMKRGDTLVQVEGKIPNKGKYIVRSVLTGNKFAVNPSDVNHIFSFLY